MKSNLNRGQPPIFTRADRRIERMASFRHRLEIELTRSALARGSFSDPAYEGFCRASVESYDSLMSLLMGGGKKK